MKELLARGDDDKGIDGCAFNCLTGAKLHPAHVPDKPAIAKLINGKLGATLVQYRNAAYICHWPAPTADDSAGAM